MLTVFVLTTLAIGCKVLPAFGDHVYDPDPADPFETDRAKVLLLGRSGHGKSSLANVIIGLPPDGIPRPPPKADDDDDDDDDDAPPRQIVEHFDTNIEPRKTRRYFEVKRIDRFWRGDVNRPIKVIDTTGYDNIKYDSELKLSVERAIKRERYIHAFLWVVNAKMVHESKEDFITDDEKTLLQLIVDTFQPGSLKNFAIAVMTEDDKHDEEYRSEIKKQISSKLMDAHQFALKPDLPIHFLNPRHNRTDAEASKRFDEQAAQLYAKIHQYQNHPAVEKGADQQLHQAYGDRLQELTEEAQAIKRRKGDKKAEKKLRALVTQVGRHKERILTLKEAKKKPRWLDYVSWLERTEHDEL